MIFQKATKKTTWARVALIGPSGSGKTYTGLTIAKAMAAKVGGRVAVLDTERGSASKYAGDVADFDVCELTSFAPQNYIDALHAAANAGYRVILADSLTHAWTGEGGILDQKDKGGADFGGWRKLTPQHNALVDAILNFPGHLVATMRVKTEYVVEKDERTGKMVPRKIGLAPVQRDGLEYEFDVVADMDPDHTMHVSKSRCPALDSASIRKPGADVATMLLDWLDDGEAHEPRIARLIAAAISTSDLAHVKSELQRATKSKSIDKAAYDRLIEAGRVRGDAIRGALERGEVLGGDLA